MRFPWHRRRKKVRSEVAQTHVFTGGIQWGDLMLPISEATAHFLAVGATGSGKTTMLRLLLQSILPLIRKGQDQRALLYDAKQDLMPLLSAICPDTRVVTLNPFDSRGAAWDLAKDVREPRVAVEIAFTLIPRQHESQPFFADAARHLLYGVMISFMLSEFDWSLADVIRALKNMKLLKQVLRRHPETRDLIGQYLYDPRLAANIQSTIATKLLPLEPIAACWETATEKVSLEAWVREEWVLVLGNSEICRSTIDAINRCIFKRACDLTLHLSESPTRRNWFVVDELADAGKLEGLVPLLKKGRSKGAAVALAFQSVSGLRDTNLYGPHFTDELLGQIGNRFIGRLECHTTAEWASQLVGDQLINVESESHTTSHQGGSHTVNSQETIRRAVLPGEFMDLEPCSRDAGMNGFFLVRQAGAFFAHLDGEWLFDHALIPPRPDVPELILRPVDAQYLRRWTRAQAETRGIRFKSPKQNPNRLKHPKPEIETNDDLFD